jgi:ATP-dependent DNA ligase
VSDFDPARLQLVKTIPVGRGWFYEPKLDGYRGLVSREARGRSSVVSRNGKDLGRFWTGRS